MDPHSNPAWQLAQLIAAIRATDPAISLLQVQTLLLIASGHADHSSDLRRLVLNDDGQPIGSSTATETSRRLRGRQPTPGLPLWLTDRQHPHRKGKQLLLSAEAQAMLALYGIPSVRPAGAVLDVELPTCDK